MLITDCEQRSDQWWKEKLGKPSSSRFNEILTASGSVSKQRQGYMYELAAQAVSGQIAEKHISLAMEEGIRREDESRKLYELITDTEVSQVGMIYPDEQKRILCSPDGIIHNEYGLELKNVLPKTQVEYLLANRLPPKYRLQVQGSLLITGFDRWDFFSYSPSLPPLILKIERDEGFIKKLKAELERFTEDLALTINRLKEL